LRAAQGSPAARVDRASRIVPPAPALTPVGLIALAAEISHAVALETGTPSEVDPGHLTVRVPAATVVAAGPV
jgi:hypothetical protein